MVNIDIHEQEKSSIIKFAKDQKQMNFIFEEISWGEHQINMKQEYD